MLETRSNTNSNSKYKKSSVCVVAFPLPSAVVSNVFLTSLLSILRPLCNRLWVITGNSSIDQLHEIDNLIIADTRFSLQFRNPSHPRWFSLLLQSLRVVIIEIALCYKMLKVGIKAHTIMFYIGGAYLFPPLLIAKLLRRKVVMYAIGLGSKSQAETDSNNLITIFSVLENACFKLADHIIVESESCVDFLNLNQYGRKINTNGARYINTQTFNMKADFNDRDMVVGYLGRLAKEKGILEFIEAIPLVIKNDDNIKFLIGGIGPLYDRVDSELNCYIQEGKVDLLGEIVHDDMADKFNELRLFVLPSPAEGLPTALLEAMACGTPVLATSVGGIPDIITNGKTGFIMDNNSPECIATNIARALNSDKLDEIIADAADIIRKQYTYDAAIERYGKILGSI